MIQRLTLTVCLVVCCIWCFALVARAAVPSEASNVTLHARAMHLGMPGDLPERSR